MSTPTPKQKQILEFTKKYLRKNKYSPSLQEIGKRFKLAKSTVHQHIEELKQRGYLEKTDYKARSIKLPNNKKSSELAEIPLLGTITAGKPLEMFEISEKIKVPKNLLSKSGENFALQVQGNSMINEGIFDGDTVIVKKQPTAENGENVVALINGGETTLKKVFREKNGFRLQPANPELKPIYVKNLEIQGRVVSIIRNFEELKKENSAQKTKQEYGSLPLNKIICGDATDVLKNFPDSSIDLIVTSPPYDGIRKYNGFNYNLHDTGKELFRVLKEGGIVAMIIQDQTKNFGKSLTSFRTIVDWVDNVGFKLFETVIYKKHGAEGAWWNKRFRVDHEYIPVFLKGERPQFFDKAHLKVPSKHGGKTMTGCATRLTNGKTLHSKKVTINPFKCRGTIWDYTTCGDGTRLKHQHPATFPNKIPYDFIKCFCPPGGIVLDPFIGSGTTALAAIELNKKYVGIDISKEYCELAKKRIKEEGTRNINLI